MTSIEDIKNVENLQQYLARKMPQTTPVIKPQSNLVGLKEHKTELKREAEKPKDTISVAPTEASAKPSVHKEPLKSKFEEKVAEKEFDDMVEGQRSIAAEIDYSRKDATRHIVAK